MPKWELDVALAEDEAARISSQQLRYARPILQGALEAFWLVWFVVVIGGTALAAIVFGALGYYLPACLSAAVAVSLFALWWYFHGKGGPTGQYGRGMRVWADVRPWNHGRFCADDESISFSTPAGVIRLGWGSVRRLIATPDCLLLIGASRSVWVPVSAFPTPGSYQDFLHFAQRAAGLATGSGEPLPVEQAHPD